MKKLLSIILILIIFSCADETDFNSCFIGLDLNATIYIDNPEFINLKVTGGNTRTQLADRNVLIIKTTSHYKAFDLQCPELDCNMPMKFDGLKLKCSCSGKEYNSLNGTPLNGEGCSALEYNIDKIGKNTLQISRYTQ